METCIKASLKMAKSLAKVRKKLFNL